MYIESKSIQNKRPQTKKIFSQIPEKAAGKDKFGLKMKSKLMKQINRPRPTVPQLALLVISTNLAKSSLSVFK